MRPSAKMRNLGGLMEATMVQDLTRCQHPQAEPVILSTGELVACVCIGCYRELPAGYIEGQASAAQREAYCTHDDEVDVSSFGQPPRTALICTGCGRRS